LKLLVRTASAAPTSSTPDQGFRQKTLELDLHPDARLWMSSERQMFGDPPVGPTAREPSHCTTSPPPLRPSICPILPSRARRYRSQVSKATPRTGDYAAQILREWRCRQATSDPESLRIRQPAPELSAPSQFSHPRNSRFWSGSTGLAPGKKRASALTKLGAADTPSDGAFLERPRKVSGQEPMAVRWIG